MAEKEIKLLQLQIEKLEQKGFDLEAWKITTIGIIEQIFGDRSHKIDLIKELKYEFSSWALRDASGSSGIFKKRAKVILESAKHEIEQFGLPMIKKGDIGCKDIILDRIGDELKGTDFKKLQQILESDDKKEKKLLQLAELFEPLEQKTFINIISDILLKINKL